MRVIKKLTAQIIHKQEASIKYSKAPLNRFGSSLFPFSVGKAIKVTALPVDITTPLSPHPFDNDEIMLFGKLPANPYDALCKNPLTKQNRIKTTRITAHNVLSELIISVRIGIDTESTLMIRRQITITIFKFTNFTSNNHKIWATKIGALQTVDTTNEISLPGRFASKNPIDCINALKGSTSTTPTSKNTQYTNQYLSCGSYGLISSLSSYV